MHKPASEITTYVLECLEGEPLNKRIKLTRALASIALPKDREALEAIAVDLEHVGARHRQLTLNFRRRAEG